MQDQYSISVEVDPQPQDLAIIAQGLGEYNFSQTGAQGRWFTSFLRNTHGEIVGGSHGWSFANYMYVELLWVHENIRRQGCGRRLLLATEHEGVLRGCRYAVLNTFSFQARGFYEKLGYRIFGELDDVIGPHRWYFLRKILSQPGEDAHGS
jgi:GNAT superfamily N-acetyltransferase